MKKQASAESLIELQNKWYARMEAIDEKLESSEDVSESDLYTERSVLVRCASELGRLLMEPVIRKKRKSV